LDLILQLGGPLIDLNLRDARGQTVVMNMAGGWGLSVGFGSVEKLRLILRAGADIEIQDDDGKSALHHAALGPIGMWRQRYDVESWVECLAILIHHGSNNHIQDRLGYTASEYAYMRNHPSTGGLIGDLWDAALVRRGYNIYANRKKHPRVPRYKKYYTRRIFERIWSSREDQCPYFEDPSYWCHHMGSALEWNADNGYKPRLIVFNGRRWYDCEDCNSERAGCIECHYQPIKCHHCGRENSLRCVVCKVGPAACSHCGLCPDALTWPTPVHKINRDDIILSSYDANDEKRKMWWNM
jgi:hypothetical protein